MKQGSCARLLKDVELVVINPPRNSKESSEKKYIAESKSGAGSLKSTPQTLVKNTIEFWEKMSNRVMTPKTSNPKKELLQKIKEIHKECEQKQPNFAKVKALITFTFKYTSDFRWFCRVSNNLMKN